MKHTLYTAAAVLALAACSKEVPSDSPEAPAQKETTIEVGFTKANYTQDSEGVLKCTWSAKDSISVVGYSSYGTVLCVDLFKYNGDSGQSKAAFTGTLTENPEIAYRHCIYPGASKSGDEYSVVSKAGRTIYEVTVGSLYSGHSATPIIIEESGSLDEINECSVMKGVVTDINGKLYTDMGHMKSYLQYNLTFPASAVGTTVRAVYLDGVNSGQGWGYANKLNKEFLYTEGSHLDRQMFTLGKGGAGLTVPASRKLTFYCDIVFNSTAEGVGDEWTITVHDNSGEKYRKVLAFTEETNFDLGVKYVVDAELEEIIP